MHNLLRGTGTAVVTPFAADGSVDFAAFRRLIDHQLEGGVEMLVPLGSTGENPTISRSERTEIFRWMIEYVNHRALIIAGTGTNDTRTSIEYTEEALSLGADAVLVVTPYYNKPTPNGLFSHFNAVADVGLPVLMYNVPGRTGLNMNAETTLRCAEIENVVGIKEASADLGQCMEIIRNAPAGFNLLSGEDNLTVPLIALGAKGVVSVASNEVPAEFSRMVRFALDGKFSEARAIHYELLELMKINFIESNPGPVKAALAMMGIIQDQLRLPLVPVKPESRKKIKEVLEQIDAVLVEQEL
ncbi:MAG: 4-hydroxy-tetrahydrodipicolinate synthase [Bacteroidota bacterium]|nr:4-hydroxy-tetrahydrodipicolinate synthase [Bacteroidota bacterium]MDP4232327.1 4-hydroxy-tetrahydrodipicolinate synthase [Bacteroidota bacterium]MDP4241466.1 4-hydroxy-tetrahydrodipicolinate synthase [Bacteroidota bacterium]MDP4286710.1 4-hydroxy-tetrahydrodipicolinate synthase [Bacteroidota bacterium]